MATFYSTEITAKDASVGNKYDSNTNAGHVKSAEFNYTTVGTETASSVIELVEIPQGSKVVGYSMTTEDLGTSTADIGTTSGGQELAAGVAMGTAGSYSAFVGPVTISTTGKVYMEILTATADADKDIIGVVYYV